MCRCDSTPDKEPPRPDYFGQAVGLARIAFEDDPADVEAFIASRINKGLRDKNGNPLTESEAKVMDEEARRAGLAYSRNRNMGHE
jgi:hypothetical protein